MKKMIGTSVIAVCAMALAATSANATVVLKSEYATKKAKLTAIPGDQSTDTNGQASAVFNSATQFIGFEGISQYDGASFGRNFIPPDTNGAVGLTQYMEVSNGSYAVFDKYTGNRLSLVSDVTFWAGAGQTGANGDSRVLYNADAKRWIAISFGASTKDIQIAVSATDNALGAWSSTKYEGFNAGFSNPIADYPTLAMDNNAVYIGTNNFGTAGDGQRFRGTTLSVIPLNSLFSNAAPTTTGINKIDTPLVFDTDFDRGFAIQGVNSDRTDGAANVLANSLFFDDNVAYRLTGLDPNTAAAVSSGAITYVGGNAFANAGPGRQPDTIADFDQVLGDAFTDNKRLIDTLDQRISSSVYEVNGRIYAVQTVSRPGEDYARVRYLVLDAETYAILDEGDIGSGEYDYYQGSIAVNRLGQVVIGFNRSGLNPLDGKIGFYAQTFNTGADGKLQATSAELFLKDSLVDDYHNGTLADRVGAGRQRWGDYSQVSVDPSTSHGFYLIGEFAREYNNAAGGHPGGTGGSRWGTWIAGIDAGGVPEPANWAMMILGFGLIGSAMRRRSTTVRFHTA